MINIKGLNKAEVLKALYDRSHVQGMGWLQAVPDGFVTIEHCEELLESQTYFDYLYGRVLKVDLSGDEFDEGLYDRDCGAGAAMQAIAKVHAKNEPKAVAFKMMLDQDFEVYRNDNLFSCSQEVMFKVRDPRKLRELIFCAERALAEMEGRNGG